MINIIIAKKIKKSDEKMGFKAKKCGQCGWNTVYSAYIRENSGTVRHQVKVGCFCVHCGHFVTNYTSVRYNKNIGIPTQTGEVKNVY